MAMIDSFVPKKAEIFDDFFGSIHGLTQLGLDARPSGEETRIRRFYQHFLEPTQ